jgi:hypothetical protein
LPAIPDKGIRVAIRAPTISTPRRDRPSRISKRRWGVAQGHGHDDRLPRRFPPSAAITVKGFVDPSMLIEIQGIAVVG